MLRVEHELAKRDVSKYFAHFDFTYENCQLPFHPYSQEGLHFIMPNNVYTPTQVLYETTNAVLHLQAFLIIKLMAELKARMLLYVDDLLFHE